MLHENMLVRFYKFINNLRSSPAHKSKLIIIPSAIALALNLFIWAVIYFKFRPLVYHLPVDQSFIPLHYNIYMGVDSFGVWQKIFILPTLGFFTLIINTLLAVIIYHRKEIISYFLSFTSLVIQVFLFIATILIILINI
jgi:hypothetical protein